MSKIDVKDYVAELSAEHRQGYQEGYAAAWAEIEKIVTGAAFDAGVSASMKRQAEGDNEK